MCVITSIVSGVTAAVMGTLSSIGTAAAGVGSALTGIGSVAAGTGFMGTSIGFTGAGASLSAAGSAAWGGITGVGTALTTGAYGAGAAAFADAASALGANAVAAGATTAANAAGATTAAQTSLAASAMGAQMVGGELVVPAATTEGGMVVSAGAAAGGASAGGVLLTEAALGANVAGSALEAKGAYDEGRDNARALRASAEQQRKAAQSVLDSAEIEAKDLSRKQRQVAGSAKAAAAANGVMLEGRAESSPAMYEQDAAAEALWDRTKLFTNANMRSQGLFAAGNDMLVAARRARRSGNLKAATAAIKGAFNTGVAAYGNRAVSLYA